MHHVHFRMENVSIEVPAGTNLRQAAQRTEGVQVYAVLGGLLSCHGRGFCGTCVVGIDPPEALSAPSRREQRFLRKLRSETAQTLRLSCQASVQADVSVTTNPDRRESWKRHPFYSGVSTRARMPAP